MSKSKLRPDQIRAAQNLRAIWRQRKREGLFQTQQELADTLYKAGIKGWSQSLIGQHLNGLTAIGASHVAVYTEYLGIANPYEIASDDVKQALSRHESNIKRVELDPQMFVKVAIHASLIWRNGGGEQKMQDQHYIAFFKAWAESEGVPVEHLKAFRAMDNAMAGQIRESDIVIARTDRLETFRKGGIYAFEHKGKGYIRRVDQQEDGSLLVTSDNAAYGERPFLIYANELASFVLLGEIFHRAGVTA